MSSTLMGKSARVGMFILILSAMLALSVAKKVHAAVFGAVTIQVVVANGSANPGDFTLLIRKISSPSLGHIEASGDTITFSMLSPGTYSITSSGPAGYSASWSGDCSAQGDIMIEAGSAKHCTVAETYAVPPPPVGGGGGDRGGTNPTPAPETRRSGEVVGLRGRSR